MTQPLITHYLYFAKYQSMNSNMYIPQSAHLKTMIGAVWQTEGRPGFKLETIIPKGVIEIIFDLGSSSSVEARLGNTEYRLPKYFINGFNTLPLQLQLPEKQYYFGVQFHPVVIKQLLGVPAGEFTNQSVDLGSLNSFFHCLWHQLAEAASFNERVKIISDWLQKKSIAKSPQEEMMDLFLTNPYAESMPVSSLAKTLYYSPRHLSRKLKDLTGMNTEEILLYKKYLHAVHLMQANDLSLTQVAYKSSFTDQSHFIRSFKTYAQMTPGEYREMKSHIPGHFYRNVQ